ncbi:hypothetical protein WJX74_002334 [Apatococcus lobatus]|uniref:Uncharacterized protein n=1 Tax=Apatococcus lobatus TaxID=904363 RepID=A0AAW1SBN8_9CHLO
MLQRSGIGSWAASTLLALMAVGGAAGQAVDPGVRTTLIANFQEQINVQQTAIVAQIGGPNSVLGGGLGIFASLSALNQLRGFEAIFNTAPDLATLIGQFTLFEQQAFGLAAAIFCRGSIPCCDVCAPGFTVCTSCLPSFILGPGGTTCTPGPTPPQLPLTPFAAPLPGALPGGYGGPAADPQAALIFAQQQNQLQASQQTSIGASFPIG